MIIPKNKLMKARTLGKFGKRPGMAALSGVLLVLAACGTDSAIDQEVDSVAKAVITPNAAAVASDVDLNAFVAPPFCPGMEALPETYLIMKFERGKENDARALIYQANIEKWARSCTRDQASGQTRMKVGFSGRVTPGPAWKGGEIILPLRVAIVEGGGEGDKNKALSSEILSVPVTLGEGAPSEQWDVVEDKFLLPTANHNIRVLFGFDEGKKKKRSR